MGDVAVVSRETRVRWNAEVPWKDLDGSVVVLDLSTGDFFELDETGSRMWLGLDGTRSLGDLAADLAREYEAALEQLESDLIAFVTDLHSRALVTIS